MAVILELEDRQGHRTRQRLDALPLTIGRSCANDVIVDDPYVDAVHARLSYGSAGEIAIDDLGSVNGVIADAGRQQQVVLRPGATVRLGRTLLRIRDLEEVLPPAIPETTAPPGTDASVSARQPAVPPGRTPVPPSLVPRGVLTRIAIVVSTLGAIALYTWLHSYERSMAGGVLAVVLAVLFGSALWAGAWAVASRAIVHRFQFSGHFTVACGVFLVMLAEHIIGEWIAFFVPDAFLYTVLSSAFGLGVLATAVAAHLSLSSTMPARRRWRAGGIVAAVTLAFVGLAALVEEESFSDVPAFSATLKPVPAHWLPTVTVAEFGAVMQQLKDDVDAMAVSTQPADAERGARAEAP